jgi:uncharacterized protein (DUF2236 family)
MAPPAGDDLWEYGRWLRELLASAEDPGYWGPSSAMWRLHREAALGLGLGRAILLQLAHPWVAQAVADHSAVHDQMTKRFVETMSAAELLVFGSRSQADAVAAHIRQIHRRVRGTLREDVGRWQKGTPYRADDPQALLWVLVTLIDTALVMYERCFRPLPDGFVQAYIVDAGRLGTMLELPAEMVPPDRRSLQRYMDDMVAEGTVAVGSIARELAGKLMRSDVPPPAHTFLSPYRSVCRVVAARTMPEVIRRQYGPVLELRHPFAWRLTGRLARTMVRKAPHRVRLDPIAATAIRRVEEQRAARRPTARRAA